MKHPVYSSTGVLLYAALVLSGLCRAADHPPPKIFEHAAKDTLTVVPMNHGDQLRFTLRNGEVRTFELRGTSARLVERVESGLVYSFDCQLLANGQPLTLRRFVCSQETFYEPWIVNGVRIWFSSSAAIFKLVPIRYPEDHDPMAADAVLCIQDATLPICPQPMKPWFPIKERFIDVGTCYNGDDPWLGPYLGKACHMGMDINMPKGTALHAPIDFQDQWIFSADHRWRGVRRWPNGDIWALQSHHVDKLLIKEREPLKAGVHYAEAAGKGIGSHQHSHFEFRTGEGVLNRGQLGGTEIDPWILFWQIFETDKAAHNELQAVMEPVGPATTGRPVQFSVDKSKAGASKLRYTWSFADGCASHAAAPEHTFTAAGVYPVTLVLEDGDKRAARTQHISVSGASEPAPTLRLQAPDEITFRMRPPETVDVYGWPVKEVPHTLKFSTLPADSKPRAKEVLIRNAGSGLLPANISTKVTYQEKQSEWLKVERHGSGNEQHLSIAVDPAHLEIGRYVAVVSVRCPNVVNGEQSFRVEVNVRPSPASDEVIVDDRDPGFFATPGAWVGHQHLHCRKKGFQKRYLTNGERTDEHALVRYTPDLAAGKYEVLFHPQTPVVESSFLVRIGDAAGEHKFRFSPRDSKTFSLGKFVFSEGTDGFVEILAKDSTGLVVADALIFKRLTAE
jgi:PKD repeat protein